MTSQETEQALREWISSAGGFIHPDLSLLSPDPVKGRKVVATKSISKGTEVMKVPTSICFLASPSKSVARDAHTEGTEQSIPEFLASQRKLTPFLRLVLRVLHEFSKGTASSLLPFIEAFPKTHNCVLGWNSIEKTSLAGTSIEAEAATDIKATYNSTIIPIFRARPEAWQGEWTSLKAFQNICGIVQSRTFHLQADNWLTGASTEGTDLYIIPGIDMVNHSTDPSARNTSLHRKDAPTPAPPAPAAEVAPAAPPPATVAPSAGIVESAGVSDSAAQPAAVPNPDDAPPQARNPPPSEQAPVDAMRPSPVQPDGTPGGTETGQVGGNQEPPTEQHSTASGDAAGHNSAPAVEARVPADQTVQPAPPSASPAEDQAAANSSPVSFFIMETEAEIPSGAELLHSYGDLSDAELLNIFGFVDTLGTDFTNPHNQVHLPTEMLVALCQEQKSGRRLGKNFKRKKDFLRDMDMLPDGFPILLDDPIPDSLVTVTQILLMSDMAEFEDLRMEIQKERRKKNGNTAVLGKDTLDDSEHSMFVCTNLLRTIDEQLSNFKDIPTTMEGANPARLAQAAHVRAGEKAIVQRQKKELLALMMSLNSDAEEEEDEEY